MADYEALKLRKGRSGNVYITCVCVSTKSGLWRATI